MHLARLHRTQPLLIVAQAVWIRRRPDRSRRCGASRRIRFAGYEPDYLVALMAGSVSGMGFAYCDFRHQGASQMLMARSVSRPRSLHRREEPSRTAADARAEVSSRVETPAVESAKLEPVKAEPVKSEPAKAEGAPELRRSTD